MTTPESQSREQFEKWADSADFDLTPHDEPMPGEEYLSAHTNDAYETWQHQQIEIDRLSAQVKVLRDALEFYSETCHVTDDVLQTNDKHWQQYCEECEPPFYVEMGDRATKALAQTKQPTDNQRGVSMSLDFYLERVQPVEVYWANITHNLTTMAERAGIYEHLWHPDRLGFTKAAELIPGLQAGLAKLKRAPKTYQKLDSPNGWGTYEHFVPFVEKILAACEEFPDATVRTCT